MVLICVSSLGLRASLEDVLAPLPAAIEMDSFELKTNLRPESSASESVRDTSEVAQGQNVSRVDDSFRTFDSPEMQESDFVSYPISQEDLLGAIEEEIHDRLRPVGQISLSPMRPLPDLSMHSQPFTVRVGGIPGRLSRNSVNLNIQVENEEGVLGNWTVPFRPHLYTDAWFPRGQLRKGDLGSASDFETRQVDLLVDSDAVVASLEVLQRHEYSRDIRPGTPLQWRDLVERSLVRKGQVVDVMAYQGMIAINMRAKVLQDGVRGDMVSLQNLESNKSFTGQVIGEGRVQVSF